MNEKKYELTDEVKHWFGLTLRRIKAVRDIPRWGVKAGDLGAFVEVEMNLAQVSGDALVSGNAQVEDPEEVLFIGGNITPNASGATLTRQKNGHMLTIRCWMGTTDELRKLADSDDWPSGMGAEYRDRYRPSLHAIAALCDARIALWEDR